MVVRLQMLTPQQLDTLQQNADNKAKADADALESRVRVRKQHAETIAC